MDKAAQKRNLQRSFTSKLWQKSNLHGRALEALHAEIREVMDNMREIDAAARGIGSDLNDWVRVGKSAIRQRDYMTGAMAVAEFHRRTRHISFIFSNFIKEIDIKHYEFILNNFDPEHKENLFSYDLNAEIKNACFKFNMIVKEAGPYDWMKEKFLDAKDYVGDTAKNFTSERGRARKILEKNYSSKFITSLKNETSSLVSAMESFFRKIIAIFNNLESGISGRNITIYVDQCKDFIKQFNDFHKKFEKYESNILAPLKNYQQEMDRKEKEEEAARQQKVQEMPPAAVSSPPPIPELPVSSPAKQVQPEKEELTSPSPYIPDLNLPEKNKTVVDEKEASRHIYQYLEKLASSDNAGMLIEDLLDKSEEFEETDLKTSNALLSLASGIIEIKKNANFIDNLNKMASSEDVNGFVNNLLEQSDLLEETNPEASGELLAVANEIIGDYKKAAGIFDWLSFKNKKFDEDEKLSDYTSRQPDLRIHKKKVDPDRLFTSIGKSFSQIPDLQKFNISNIYVSPFSIEHMVKELDRKLSLSWKINEPGPVLQACADNIGEAIVEAIVNGKVVNSARAPDGVPGDKIYVISGQVDLFNVCEKLLGTMDIVAITRLSNRGAKLSLSKIRINGVNGFQILSDEDEEESKAPDTVRDLSSPFDDEESDEDIDYRDHRDQDESYE